jgi:hypothetical protein
MFCPKCGAHNLEDAKYCRSCGADIRLVPQALRGRLPEGVYGEDEGEALVETGRKERKSKSNKPPTLEKGLENLFSGIAFLIIFMLGFFYMRGLFMVWVWFVIPGLGYVGQGLGQLIRSRSAGQALPPSDSFHPAAALPPTPALGLPSAATGEIKSPPASVTESTTRNLASPRERTAGDA